MRKSRSTFGHIVDSLNIRTTDLAKAILVDASLVSKWKTGARSLTEESSYFDDVVAYLIERAWEGGAGPLKTTLLRLFPSAKVDDERAARLLLRSTLAGTLPAPAAQPAAPELSEAKSIPAYLFDGTQGLRQALSSLLDLAESAREPGEFIFIDTNMFSWRDDDGTFSAEFVNRLLKLLDNDFHATFAVRIYSGQEEFRRFFDSFNSLIFHKNVNWYYVQYYDKPLIGMSIGLLNQSMVTLGLFTGMGQVSAMAFQESGTVLQYEQRSREFIQKCIPLFHFFQPTDAPRVFPDLTNFIRRKTFIAFLPDPAFIATSKPLLLQILTENGIDLESEPAQKALELNAFFRSISGVWADGGFPNRQETVFIFQLEQMLARAEQGEVTSRSLSIVCEREIRVSARHHAEAFRDLAELVRGSSNLHVVLAMDSETSLPCINCWCYQRELIVQMTRQGFRYCDESTVVSIAAEAMQQCIHRVPPQRRSRASVADMLDDLAAGIERD